MAAQDAAHIAAGATDAAQTLTEADIGALATHFLAIMRRMGLGAGEVALEAATIEEIAASEKDAVLFLRSGAAIGVEATETGLRLLGKGGMATAFDADALRDAYVGHALVRKADEDADDIADDQDASEAVLDSEKPALEIALDQDEIELAAENERPALTVRGVVGMIFGRIFGARFSLLAQLCAAAALSNLFAFALPLYTMSVYDRVIPHSAMSTLVALTSGVALVLIIDLILRIVKTRLMEAVALRTSHEFQEAIFHRLTRAELNSAPRSTGLVSSTFQAVEALCQSAPMLVVGFLIDLPFAIFVLFYIASIGGWLVAAPIAAMAALLLINLAAHLTARRASRRGAMLGADRVAFLDQTVSLMETVKTTNAAPILSRIWRKITDTGGWLGHEQRMASSVAGQAAAVISQATTVGVLVIGAHLAQQGDITMGVMVATSILVGRSVAPVGAAFSGALRFMQAMEGAKPAAAILSAPAEAAGDATGAEPRRLKGAVAFNNVTFSYPDAGAPALREISFSVAPGEHVALIGRIGCGKSTALRLMMRLHGVQDGAIQLDGHDIRQFDPFRLRADMSYLPQETDLFDDTIFENIALGIENPSENQLFAAAQASGVTDIASKLSEGYSFRIGPNGRHLSGGERQMVALCRALARPSPILLLDEPTAALDNQYELAVVERLKPLLQGRTLILSTHRAPTLQLVDRVIWLDQGRVIADGPKDDVLRRLGGR